MQQFTGIPESTSQSDLTSVCLVKFVNKYFVMDSPKKHECDNTSTEMHVN